MHEERGQTSAEFAGVLLVIALVFAALAVLGLAPGVAGAAKKAVCQIVNSTCEEATEPVDEPPAQPPEGPTPIDFNLPFPVLPFPGSMSVSCSYTTSSPGTCQPAEPGVSVGTEGAEGAPAVPDCETSGTFARRHARSSQA